jgi:hypothetical protein
MLIFNKMKTYFNIKAIRLSIFIGIISMVGFSCTEKIDLDLDTTYVRLVVDGSITTDTTAHRVVLSKSGDALNKLPIQYVSNATVTITDGTNTYPLVENANEKGVYETVPSVYGVTGETYTLNISNIDIDGDGIMENYNASSYLKGMSTIDSISLTYQKFSKDESAWIINLYAWDLGGTNYYLVKAAKNGILLTDSIKEYGRAVNEGFSGRYYSGFGVYYLSQNKIDERLKKGDTVTLIMNCITEEYYRFLEGFQKEYGGKIPIFSGPSSNVTTNIEPKDKAVGFFAAYSVEKKSVIFDKDEIVTSK